MFHLCQPILLPTVSRRITRLAISQAIHGYDKFIVGSGGWKNAGGSTTEEYVDAA